MPTESTPLTLDYAFFAARLHGRFPVADAAGIALELRSVTPFPGSTAERPGFSLIFAGPLAHPLPQMTYMLDCPDAGSHAIFLVPVARDATGFQYEAVFN